MQRITRLTITMQHYMNDRFLDEITGYSDNYDEKDPEVIARIELCRIYTELFEHNVSEN